MSGGKQQIFKLAELFSGPGGLAHGAVNAKVSSPTTTYSVKSVWANDIDEDTCRTYAENIHKNNDGSVECNPIQDVNFDKIPNFNALAFGFPCNDFSLVGKQKGFEGKYGPLYSYGIKALEIHNPYWFIAENVSGLRSANEGFAFNKILNDLDNAGEYGYKITPHLYKFEEYGVPQRRHRIVIIGIRKDLDVDFQVPAPSVSRHKTALEAIEQPPIPDNAPNHEYRKQSSTVAARLTHIPPGGNAWSREIPEHLRLNVKGARLSNIYKRLDPSKPAYTVTGSGGGGTHVYHWTEPRSLTNRERARLQTFPDNFVFYGSVESVRKQIGMAVPPLATKQIIESVLKTFAGITYPAVESNLNSWRRNPIPLSLT